MNSHTCQTCDFSQPAAGIVWPLTCRCGVTFQSAADSGTAPPRRPPGLATRGRNYASALAKWLAAGRPKRSPQEVAELRAICRDCSYFRADNCTHEKCGCRVGAAGRLGDKLTWKTESCPVGKWGTK